MSRACALMTDPCRLGLSAFPGIDGRTRRENDAVHWPNSGYLRNGGDLEVAVGIAGHESTRTTQRYNRLHEKISLGEIERIHI